MSVQSIRDPDYNGKIYQGSGELLFPIPVCSDAMVKADVSYRTNYAGRFEATEIWVQGKRLPDAMERIYLDWINDEEQFQFAVICVESAT